MRIRNIAQAIAEAVPRSRSPALLVQVQAERLELVVGPPPVPPAPPNSSGSPKSWVAPIVETTTVKRIVGRSAGTVTWRNCCQRLAPSSAAASYRSLRDRLHRGQVDQRVVAGPPPDRRSSEMAICEVQSAGLPVDRVDADAGRGPVDQAVVPAEQHARRRASPRPPRWRTGMQHRDPEEVEPRSR